MLPESYEQRDFHPLESHPAKLFDFRLGFFSSMGFAEAIPSPGDSMHGVVHRVTEAQMLELDKVEVGYIRLTGKARPYGPRWEQLQTDNNNMAMTVSVYCRPVGANKEDENRPPKARYLEILIAGAKHHGVDPCYIAFLEKHDFQPRTPPDQFLHFGDPRRIDTLQKFQSLATMKKEVLSFFLSMEKSFKPVTPRTIRITSISIT
jgi:hypothetical protein